MAVLPIITAPHPVLAARAREVEADEFGEDLDRLTRDMAETMYAAPGVGLAAPQVEDGRRVVVIDSSSGEERGSRLFRMVNPVITKKSKETIDWQETCLSVPDLEVWVKRHKYITVEWQDPLTGEKREQDFEEYEAVICQHEFDHLQGTVLLDRVSSFKRGRWIRKQKKLQAPAYAK
ncbi:MAG: peptide deformylase [Deltaproteobacteria bacterium]|nr:MAG: peptide deformylase [Deltaproteobacteria bacterium]